MGYDVLLDYENFPHSTTIWLNNGWVGVPGKEIYCAEANDSPSLKTSDSAPPTSTRHCLVVGTNNRAVAQSLFVAWLDWNQLWKDYDQPLKNVSYTPNSEGAPVWDVQFEYGGSRYDWDKVEISFSTVGGTAHIERSNQTAAYSCIANTPPNEHYNMIGITDSGEYEGMDAKRPSLQMSVSVMLEPKDVGDLGTFMRNVANMTARFNEANYMGFRDGEILFDGVQSCEMVEIADQEDYTSVYTYLKTTYSFLMSPTIWHVVYSPFGHTGWMRKNGWDAEWIEYMKWSNDDGKVLTIPRQVNIERIYPPGDFTALPGMEKALSRLVEIFGEFSDPPEPDFLTPLP